MKPKDNMTKKDSTMTIETSPTLRKKGYIVGRCFINIMKVFRMCKKSKKVPKPR